MNAKTGLLILGLMALILTGAAGCDGDDPSEPGDTNGTSDDTMPPAEVTDLQVTAVAGSVVTLAWTAPGDDGDTGTASAYDLRYGSGMVTEATWADFTQVADEPDPLAAGTGQTVSVDVGANGDWAFALKAADEVPNWSGLSNGTVATVGAGNAWEIHQLTSEGTNRYPSLSDGFVTWVGTREADCDEIWIASLTGYSATPTKLTDNCGQKIGPDSHGSEKIIWSGREGNGYDWEIWVYDKYATPRFAAHTDNEYDDLYPVLAGGGSFAWCRGPTMYRDIHWWNGSLHEGTSISEAVCPVDEWTNGPAAADDGAVVWRAYERSVGDDVRIYLWDGTYRNLSETLNAQLAHSFSLYGGTIAYAFAGMSTTLRYWDGETVHELGYGEDPSLYDGAVAFEIFDGHDWEIHYWDGAQVIEVTDNDYDDVDASLDGSYLAWSGRPEGAFHIMWTRVE